MGFEKSEEELRILTDTYHDEILQTASDMYGLRYVNSEMLWDNSWDDLFYEPCFQMLFFDADDEMVEADQFMICKDIRGFAREPINEDELVRMYGMKKSESENLFNIFIEDFLKSTEIPSPLKVYEIFKYNENIIDIMFDIGYDNRFEDEEKVLIYELTNDIRFIPKEAQDIFIF